MRKSHKQEMLALLGTMGKIADLLPKMANPAGQIQDILAACECLKDNLEQEAAPRSLDLLQIIESSVEQNKLDILEHIKNLESAFNSEVKIKLEVLFLPYKTSMWDSLESIYLAAKDDPACQAFVMPIPYYDKKSGKFTEMHWETNYPKNILLIDYRKYNMEQRHPDMIFIHNPYDGYNTVTSVHPDFYSEKLRNLTDCLVYVPYFAGDGRNIEEPFCTLPACIFAHKVIAQTKEEREIYVRVYKDFAKRNNVPERLDKVGDKFLALGSPKLDKAVSTKSENCEIPEEWEKLIRNSDGTRKKVVFYNTSIGSLLQYSIEDNKPSGKYLQKLKTVFEFFKRQNNAVLLWRPHPLLEGTIKSMRSWLEQEYAQIVNEYKNGNYGIYDNTEDLNRSIAISDMYYGDSSSVITLFNSAEKPVLGQAIGVLAISALYDDGVFIWIMNVFNMLYKYDKHSKKTEYMATIPVQRSWAFTAIAGNNRKLYLTSAFGYGIFVFDMDKKQVERNYECNYEIQNAVSFKKFVYFIPREFSAVLRLAPDTDETAYFSPQLDVKGKVLHTCVVGTEIAMIIQGMSAIVFFNMESGEYIMEKAGTDSEQYNNMCFDGHNYYLNPFDRNYIVKWNRESSKISKIKFPTSFSGTNFFIQYSGKHVWLFPFAAKNAYKINTNTEKIAELPRIVEHFENRSLGWYYNLVLASENYVYASTWDKGIVEFNVNTSELNFIKPVTAENFIEPSLLHYLSDYEIPAEWEKQIRNADGTRKKVVFYNAGISALLESSMVAKKNNAVLLWRPGQQLERECLQIASEYKNGNHGIYDDTEDLNRAVAVSDVYYGDRSRVVELFGEAKKTVLLSGMSVSHGLYDDGSFIWFMDILNTLYKHNKQSKETEYMGIIAGQNNWGNLGIAVNGKKLYFAPYFKNDRISIFDMDKKSFEQIDFKDDCRYDRKFTDVVCFENFAYFIPQEFPAIMRLNTDTGDIEYFSQWMKGLSELQISKFQEVWKNVIFFNFCVADEEIAMVVNGANAIVFFNMKTCNYEIKTAGEKSEQYNHICFDGQNYYLAAFYKDYIVKWNRQSNETLKIKIPSFSRRESISFSFTVRFFNEHVWLFPHAANSAYKINMNTNEITELPELVEHFEGKSLAWYYNITFASGDFIYAATLNKGIVEYNTKTSELNFIEPNVTEPQLLKLLNSTKTAGKTAGKNIWKRLTA
jgi:hypothetical protein